MRLDDQGDVDFGLDQFQAPDPSAPAGKKINPLTGLPEGGLNGASSNTSFPGQAPTGTTPQPDGTNVTPLPGTPTPPVGAAGTYQPKSPNDPLWKRVQSALASSKHPTDDPNYWYDKISGDPNGAGSAWDYWVGLMNDQGGDNGASPGPTSPGSPAPAGGGGGAASAPDTSALSSFLMNWLTGQSTQQTGAQTALLQRLLSQADELSKPVTADDPNIKAASDAYHGTVARSVSDYRTRAAERAHAEGVGTGAFDAQIGNAEMGAGRAEANFTTGMMHDTLMSNRTQLANMLEQARSLLSAQDAADIQSRIAAIDGILGSKNANTSAVGVDNAFSLGTSGQDLTKLLGLGSLDLQKLGIGNQNNQFYDKFGADNAFNEAQLEYLYKALGLAH